VTVESDWRVPSPLLRLVGIVAAAYIAIYGFMGVMRNDLEISLSKSSVGVQHLHGRLAWLCFTGMIMMAVGMVCFLGPPFGEGKFDFDERRGRFGPIVAIGLGLIGASHGIAAP